MKNFLSALLLLISVAWGADAQAQGRIVSGFVSDDSGDPLIGVTVTDPGAQTVAISDAGGAFTIRIPGDDATLRFSYVGFQTQDIVVGGRSEIAVVMTADASLLEDVVVIGYGVQQKKLVTGATVQVSGDNVAKLNTVNVLGALQSQTPGVSITQASGMPGEGFKVFVRGMGTMGDASPLYVIDGVPGGDINNLNPGDIERIDVLKDAASAAIYGARAANGVILVTTKQGRAGGKAQISFDAYYGIQNVYRMPDLLNAQEYAMIQNEARIMDGLAPYDFATEAYGTDPENHWQKIESGEWNGTNWLDESRNRNAPVQNYTFNATGGSDMSVYSIGFGYTAQEGILGKPVQPRYERYTARVNSERTLIKGRSFDIIKLGENISYSYNQNTGRFGLGDMYYNDIRNMMTMSPFLPLLDEDGKTHYAIPWEIRQANPIALMKARSENMSEGHSLRANVFLTIQPIKNLIFKSTFGYSYGGGSYRSFLPKYELSSTVNNTLEEVSQSMYDYGSMTLENTLTYTFDINEDHHFTALLGQSIEKGGLGGDLEAANGNPIFHDFKHAYLDNAPWTGTANTATSLGGGPEDPSRWASFFGRVSYDYQNKYMATVILRADGSHNFMRGHRWGYFPSVSAGWAVTEEPFMESVRPVMDFLKIRASYGQNGNAKIDAFQYLSPIAYDAFYPFGNDKNNLTLGSYPRLKPNELISWETSEQTNIGLDASFLRSRLGLVFDYYIKNTRDWLVVAPQLASEGAGAPFVNGGDIRNSGVEVGLTWRDEVGEFRYGANVNFSYNKNKITRLANEEGIFHGPADVLMNRSEESFRAQVGYPIGYFYGYSTAGIFQSQEHIDSYEGAKLPDARPGDVIWVDYDGENGITSDDKHMIGNPYPDFRFGIGLDFAWRGLDLNITMNGVMGNQIMSSQRSWPDNPKDNFTSEILGRWHGEGTSNRLPRLSTQSHTNRQWVSDLYVYDGDYLRMQNITLGYDFGQIINAGFLSQLRVYVTAQNLFTVTKYPGMDPEVGYNHGDDYSWSSGIDLGFYPSPRTWIFGVNLKF